MSSSPTAVFPPPTLTPLIQQLAQQLLARKETVSIAETAAGGLLSAALLSYPGASKFYAGGLTLYTLPSRVSYAGWTDADIAAYRGPTTDVVAGIAKRVRGELHSSYTLCESGTAGPTGGETRNRRPGYVALAVDCERGCFVREVETGVAEGEGQRVGNMLRFAEEALQLLLDVVTGESTRGAYGGKGFVSQSLLPKDKGQEGAARESKA